MTDISRAKLFGKLDHLAFQAMESATSLCRLRGNPYVELVHWFQQMLQEPDSDLRRINERFGLNNARLVTDLINALERLPARSGSVIDLSGQLDEAMERSWIYGALQLDAVKIRSGHILLGVLGTSNLRHTLFAMSREFEKINRELLMEQFSEIVQRSPEQPATFVEGDITNVPGQSCSALQRYTSDLTEQARRGELDPVVGRNDEVRQLIDILMRRRQNNPLLAGEAGVGKTAVVEGFAQRIVAGDVPQAFRQARVLALDIGLLQAGAGVKGEFEQRLRQVVDEVQAAAVPTLLFIDEVHTLVGAGGQAGTGDAANLLKPMLARGQLRTIGATTWDEYKKHIEKDPALKRRFQVLRVEEPSPEVAINMLRSVLPTLQAHHQVQILDEALHAAVNLSHRYLPERQLPDKAISLLDTACARVRISQQALPGELADHRERLAYLHAEKSMVQREQAIGLGDPQRLLNLEQQLREELHDGRGLEARWQIEAAWVEEIQQLRERLQAEDEGEFPERAALLERADALQQRLQAAHARTAALVLPDVDAQAVADVLQGWTGIPLGTLQRDELDTILDLAASLEHRIIGQPHALQAIASRIQTSRAGLDHPGKPVGVFMLAGPSGVGKTETALALAELLYGGEHNLVTINMSEYQEPHSVASLKGAPPGYVGYGEGGVLTEAVRRRPHCVILLDEMEKAHRDVHEVFFQVFDKGWMEDGEGQVIDFRNTLILMTTNVGTEALFNLRGGETAQDLEQLLRPQLLNVFPPALLGRLVAIPYFPLNDEMLGSIVEMQLQRVVQRVQNRYQVPLHYDAGLVAHIVGQCTDRQSGGRMVDTILTRELLPQMSRVFLQWTKDQKAPKSLSLNIAEGGVGLEVEM